MAGRQLYDYGDMVSFNYYGRRLLGEVCIFDRNRIGDGVDSYDIMVCADLYGDWGVAPSGCLFKHIPEPDIEGRVGRAMPLEPGMLVSYSNHTQQGFVQLYGRIEEIDDNRVVLELRGGATLEVRRHGACLDPLVTRWMENDGRIFSPIQYSGFIIWDDYDKCWCVVDPVHGDNIEDVWPGSSNLQPGAELEVLLHKAAKSGGLASAHTTLSIGLDGKLQIDGLGPMEQFENLPVRAPYVASFKDGERRIWNRYYPKPFRSPDLSLRSSVHEKGFEYLTKLGEAEFVVRNLVTGEMESFSLDQLYGYEGEESGVFIRGSGTKLVGNDGSMSPFLDIRIKAEPELRYALYMNGQLIGRAADPSVMPLGDVNAYVRSGDPNLIDEFTLVDTSTGEVVERANGQLDVWDKENDLFVTQEKTTIVPRKECG